MKKAIYISILCTVMLTACGNVSESTKSAETSAVNQTTVTVTSVKEEKDTSEATTTTRKSSQTVSETSIAKTTKKSTVSSLVVSEDILQEQIEKQSYPRTEQPQENTQVNTTQKPAVTTTQQKQNAAKQTTTAPPKPATTTQEPQTTTQKPSTTKPQNTVQWSDPMKAWRKLCEGQSLSGDEQNLIRNEILEYAKSFNGKRDIHVSFGIDEYDIFYEKPLDLTVRNDMTDLSYANMDAYVDADRGWLLECEENEDEVYSIVNEARENCLHVIDYGLFNRWEIYSGNNALKYASDIEFNVGFDGTAIWFLTED